VAAPSEHEKDTRYVIRPIKGSDIATGTNAAMYAVVAAGTLGPFVTAFCTELGKRLGGTTADWASKVYRRTKRGKTELFVRVDDVGAALVLEEGSAR
jgi:hypothetical protein